MNENGTALLHNLSALYGEPLARQTYARLHSQLERYMISFPDPGPAGEAGGRLGERDVILITYGDQVRHPGAPPLHTLAEFCQSHLKGLVTGIHILPFYPYSSDDGFSVIDYKEVDPELGSWRDIHSLGQDFKLMFDAVINHISVKSEWFQRFLRGDPAYRDYFIVVEGEPDLSLVVRPRALPLLTRFATPSGEADVWTTFSGDQIDLNYRNPRVLLEIVDALLFYAGQGVQFIRLDAIAYLWKDTGTPSIHLPQTHQLIQFFRAVLDAVAPHVQLITETNVPHADNVSYFGDGTNEAQMVYNFALPPLVLHALHTGRTQTLSRWAAGLSLPSDRVTFFNFLASHDGIGLNPAGGILSSADIDQLVERVVDHGGLVSFKHNPDGSQSPYELNINYFDALSAPDGREPLSIQIDRFVAAHGIMFSLAGLPAVYFHSLFGSRSWIEGVRLTGRNRTINRQKLSLVELENELSENDSQRHRVFDSLANIVRARASSPAFHPYGRQRVLDFGPAVFAVLRSSPVGERNALCIQNLSDQVAPVEVDLIEQAGFQGGQWHDLITQQPYAGRRAGFVELQPYQALWLEQPT